MKRRHIALVRFAAFGSFGVAWLFANGHVPFVPWMAALVGETLLIVTALETYKRAGAKTPAKQSPRVAVLVALVLPVLGGVAAALPIWGRHMAHLNKGDTSDPYHSHPITEIGHVH